MICVLKSNKFACNKLFILISSLLFGFKRFETTDKLDKQKWTISIKFCSILFFFKWKREQEVSG